VDWASGPLHRTKTKILLDVRDDRRNDTLQVRLTKYAPDGGRGQHHPGGEYPQCHTTGDVEKFFIDLTVLRHWADFVDCHKASWKPPSVPVARAKGKYRFRDMDRVRYAAQYSKRQDPDFSDFTTN
jgi:hypothetical protein